MNKKTLKQHLCLLYTSHNCYNLLKNYTVFTTWQYKPFSPSKHDFIYNFKMVSPSTTNIQLKRVLFVSFSRTYLVCPPFAAVTAAHLSGLLPASSLAVSTSRHNGLSWFSSVWFVLFLKEGFRKALQMVEEEFLDRLEFYQSSWLPARAVVEEAVKKRHQVCSDMFWPSVHQEACPDCRFVSYGSTI